MIDLVKAKQAFKEYVSQYDRNCSRIRLKIVHMYHVAKEARQIAEKIDLSKEEQELAELIGLLHDIGRFEQWKWYQTYSDKFSIDHGQKSVEVLFAEKRIRDFVQEEQYDSVIYKAINNHNKLEIERGLSEQELLHSKIVRDADNLDIFRTCLENRPEEYTHFGSQNVAKEILTPEFFEEFKKEHTLLYGKAKTDMDIMVAIMAHMFAINFKESLQKIKEKNYILRFVKHINPQDEYTKEKLNEIADYAMEYIERKISEEKNDL